MSVASRHRVPRWVGVGLLLVFGVGGTLCLAFYWPWLTRTRVEARHPLPASIERRTLSATEWHDLEKCFIGHSEEAISTRFGRPQIEFNGPYGMPPVEERRTYPEARTRVYVANGGQLYVAFCRQRGKWVCYTAAWLPTGASF